MSNYVSVSQTKGAEWRSLLRSMEEQLENLLSDLLHLQHNHFARTRYLPHSHLAGQLYL
jgi:hypothetical protein